MYVYARFWLVIPQTNKVKLRGSAKIILAMRLGSGEAKRAAWGVKRDVADTSLAIGRRIDGHGMR